MRIKGVIGYLKIRKKYNLKSDNIKNISRSFSGALEGNVGSVQFQTVTCSSLYFSSSIGSFQCLVNTNYRVLICCTEWLPLLCLFWLPLFASLFNV